MKTTSLSQTRAADRRQMANAVADLAQRMNVKLVRFDQPGSEVLLELETAQGLCVLVEFEARPVQPDVYLLAWHMHHTSPARLNNATFGGNVNPHHQKKATYVAHGFEELMQMLEKGWRMSADGTAFLPESAAA